jgi:hypothetical protein
VGPRAGLDTEDRGKILCPCRGEVHTVSIIRVVMMEAVRTSETSVNLNVTTRRYISEGSKIHTSRLENLKSHRLNFYLKLS